MTARGVAAASIVLVFAFAAIVVSLVRARDPLDGSVTKSFNAGIAKLSASQRAIVPLGCRKRSVDLYDCSALVRPRGGLESIKVSYTLMLRDDGCWGTIPPEEPFARGVPQRVNDCIDA